MSIMELGALGEFFGVFALVATLIYLSIQVRHGQSQSKQAVIEARTSGFRDLMLATAISDSLATAFQKASEALDEPQTPFEVELTSLGLDLQDALRLRSWWVARFRMDEAEFQGIGGGDAEHRGRLVMTYGRGVGHLFWKAGPRKRQSSFIDHVNGLLADMDRHGWDQQADLETQQ